MLFLRFHIALIESTTYLSTILMRQKIKMFVSNIFTKLMKHGFYFVSNSTFIIDGIMSMTNKYTFKRPQTIFFLTSF